MQQCSCLLPRNQLPVATASTCSPGCLHLRCRCLQSAPLATTCRRGPRPIGCVLYHDLWRVSPPCRYIPVIWIWLGLLWSVHKWKLPHIHPSIHPSIDPFILQEQTRSPDIFISGDVNVIYDHPRCDLPVVSVHADPLSASNWLCNMSFQSLDDYCALSPSLLASACVRTSPRSP